MSLMIEAWELEMNRVTLVFVALLSAAAIPAVHGATLNAQLYSLSAPSGLRITAPIGPIALQTRDAGGLTDAQSDYGSSQTLINAVAYPGYRTPDANSSGLDTITLSGLPRSGAASGTLTILVRTSLSAAVTGYGLSNVASNQFTTVRVFDPIAGQELNSLDVGAQAFTSAHQPTQYSESVGNFLTSTQSIPYQPSYVATIPFTLAAPTFPGTQQIELDYYNDCSIGYTFYRIPDHGRGRCSSSIFFGGLSLFDATGAALTSFIPLSESGYDYRVPVPVRIAAARNVAVPEPAALALLGLGLPLLIARRRAR